MSNGKMKVVGYVRVSTEQQAADGVSLRAQMDHIEKYCELYNLDLVEMTYDVASAKSMDNRPGLDRALDLLGEDANGLVIAKLDRLTRSVRDLNIMIEKYFDDFDIISVSEQIDTRSAGGRMVLNILMSVSQWERETIGERTATAMANMKTNGEYTGGKVPFGYKIKRVQRNGETKKILVVDKDEVQVVKMAKTLHGDGLSLRKIGAALVEAGHFPRTGGRIWNPRSIKDLLASDADVAAK